MSQIRPERVAEGVSALMRWRDSVHSQKSAHLVPLLALLQAGAGVAAANGAFRAMVDFPESKDDAFWDAYLKLRDDGGWPYFDPVAGVRRNPDHPHGTPATIRKRTFVRSWGAAEADDPTSPQAYGLAADYAARCVEGFLTKAGKVHRIPALDLALVLGRHQTWPDGADVQLVLDWFRGVFPQSDPDFHALFMTADEDAERVFQSAPVSDAAYDLAVKSVVDVNAQTIAPPPVALLPGDGPDEPDDEVFRQVLELLALGTSGIILIGPPGTGKTWHAKRVARRLVENADTDIFPVQFHPSYGYEDFVEGFKPDEESKSGFKVVDKTFLQACKRAGETTHHVVVIVDEINRGDPARVFGELLTYLERDYRGVAFRLPFSGGTARIPSNVLLLGTMNPHDRSIARVDAAFVRRFDHIQIDPSPEALRDLLARGVFRSSEIEEIVGWFERLQRRLPFGLGHAVFNGARDLSSLVLVWTRRALPTVLSMPQMNDAARREAQDSFDALISRLRELPAEPA